ncbi:MAG: hypothetical protein GQ570_10165 [Helicobacteraceae bacterium]|nr:hypothetical protein [Helicobacteraceae bacterium]
MVEVTHNAQCHGSILSIGHGKKYLFIMDNQYNLTLLNNTTLGSVTNVALKKAKRPLQNFSKAMAVDDNNNFIYALTNVSKVFQYKITKKVECISDKKWHEKNIGAVTIDLTGTYCASGGDDGKVHLYDYFSGSWLTSFDFRPDYISKLTFSKDGKFLLSGAYDRKVFAYNLQNYETIAEFAVSGVPEDSLFFDENKKIATVTREKTLEIYSLESEETIYNKEIFKDWPTVAITDESQRYLIVGTKSNLLYLFDLDTLTLIEEISLSIAGVSSLKITTNSLLVGGVDGNLLKIDLFSHCEIFETSLKLKKYDEADKLFAKNVFLYLSKEMELFHKGWVEVLEIAKTLLSANKLSQAQELVNPFTLKNPKYEAEFTALLKNAKEIKELLFYVRHKKFKQAYALVDEYPILLELQPYQQLEAHWFSALSKARALIASGSSDNKLKALDYLKNFNDIETKKKLISLLFTNQKIFEKTQELVKKKEFVAYFQIVESYPFLKEVDLYQKTITLSNSLYDRALTLEQSNKFDKAKQVYELVAPFPHLQKLTRAKLISIDNYLQFKQLVKDGNIQAAYKKAEGDSYILNSELFQSLLVKFNDEYTKAQEIAETGKPSFVLTDLQIYFGIKFWNEKTKNIMRSAYIKEMLLASSESSLINWEKTLSEYIALFGKDTLLTQLFKDNDSMPKSILNDIDDNPNTKEEINYSKYLESVVTYMNPDDENKEVAEDI